MSAIQDRIDRVWEDEIVPTLCDYIRIPNVSEAFDPDWEANGHMERVVMLIRDWCATRPVAGLTVDVQRLRGTTPLIVGEVPATDPALAARTVLLYGHLDKQPETTGWREGLGPWTPVIEGERLYGRGGADDGYAAFASLLAIEAAQAEGLPHARLVVLIEAGEESGSPDLPAHLEALAERIGEPELVICLDSGCLDDQRLWVTTSLRGLASVDVTVEVLTEGVHSGAASGVAPSSFRLLRQLLDRIEDSATGRVLLPELHVEIPDDRRQEAKATAAEVDHTIADGLPFAGGTRPMVDDPAGQLLARTWLPTVSYVGIDGMPPTRRAGNVLRPSTSLALSFRLPPTCDHEAALRAIRDALLADAPSGAVVRVERPVSGPGWNAPRFAPWLSEALAAASTETFGRPARTFGEGGTIPFMAMLGERYPAAQFVITGVLGPGTNAHGPNEFLDLRVGRKITTCIARLLGAHAASPASS